MRSFILYSLFLYFTISIFLGCGSDNPVNNNPNPPSDPVIDTVSLFVKDSIYFNENNLIDSSAVSYLCTLNIDTIRVNFNFHTSGIRSLAVYKIDSDTLLNYSKFSAGTFDTVFSLTVPVNNINFINFFSLRYDGGTFSGFEHGSLRNIKLWYIRRS